jgi:pullulanase
VIVSDRGGVVDLAPDLLQFRVTRFALWRPANSQPPPILVIGRYVAADPPRLDGVQRLELRQDAARPDLWSLDLDACGLDNGVYHYWFEVSESRPDRPSVPIQVTDPLTSVADWRLLSPQLPAPFDDSDRSAAAVVLVRDGQLLPCDPGGELPDLGR